ncbi:hypothetical protein [Sphingobacterium sp. UBA6308]|nr:hypothetical protein [Sphingobacterium sp. UBA6308]
MASTNLTFTQPDVNTGLLLNQLKNGSEHGYTAEIDQTFRGNMEMCPADI